MIQLRVSIGNYVLLDLVSGVRADSEPELVHVGAEPVPTFGFGVPDDMEMSLYPEEY